MDFSHIQFYYLNNKWTHSMMEFYTLGEKSLLVVRQLQVVPADFSERNLKSNNSQQSLGQRYQGAI